MNEEVALESIEPASAEKKSNTWMIVGIFAIVILCCCLIACGVIFMLTLLGPSVGNVFSTIIEEVATPMP